MDTYEIATSRSTFEFRDTTYDRGFILLYVSCET